MTVPRLDRIRQRMGEYDALLVTNLDNIRWLSGFTGSSAWLLLSNREVVLITDGRYAAQSRRQLDAAGVEATILVGTNSAELADHLSASAARFDRLGFEAAHLSVMLHQRYSSSFDTELVATVGVVEAVRRSKDPTEIAALAKAASIADRALADVAATIAAGQTEAEVRNRLEARMRELGASGPSYETIVAGGPTNAALPHHRPTTTVLESGDLVIIDVGALVDGYHSDMTRTFVIGQPTEQQQAMYDVVRRSQQAGLDVVRAGLPAVELDRACRQVIAEAGFGEWFAHGTGHGVGLLIHEDPFANATSKDVLQVGDVVTVEPGVYREGFGGIRIEDLVVVTEEGCRNLTTSPKDSPCLPSPPTTSRMG